MASASALNMQLKTLVDDVHATGLASIEELDLPEEVRRKIYRENAIALFGVQK